MSTPTQTPNGEATITALVSGIVNDGQELLNQQLTLFKTELRQEIAKARDAALSLTAGLGITIVGGVLLCFMLAHLIAWGFEIPLWVGFGCVGGGLFIAGLLVYAAGRNKLESVHPVPEQTVQVIKENVQWLKTPK